MSDTLRPSRLPPKEKIERTEKFFDLSCPAPLTTITATTREKAAAASETPAPADTPKVRKRKKTRGRNITPAVQTDLSSEAAPSADAMPGKSEEREKKRRESLLSAPGLKEVRPALVFLITQQVAFINAGLLGGKEIQTPIAIQQLCERLQSLSRISVVTVAAIIFQRFDWQKVPFVAIYRITIALQAGAKNKEQRDDDYRVIAGILRELESDPVEGGQLRSSPMAAAMEGRSLLHEDGRRVRTTE